VRHAKPMMKKIPALAFRIQNEHNQRGNAYYSQKYIQVHRIA
jgi:hypothetical protein